LSEFTHNAFQACAIKGPDGGPFGSPLGGDIILITIPKFDLHKKLLLPVIKVPGFFL